MDFIGELLAAPFICVGWIIVGAIAGALARSLMRSADAPFLSDFLLGIAGAFFGGLIAGALGVGPSSTTRGLELVLVNLVIATLGAIILIGVGRMFARR
jgi:uncharacterized membrane protein YeaQ/YmgE (transglycosylase-associated protein family)